MKISPSNIGTASQSFNGKSTCPYIWSWDMSAAAGSDLGNSATNAIDAPGGLKTMTAVQAPAGIILGHTSDDPYYDLRDKVEYDRGSGAVSGELNSLDTVNGRYLHFVLTRNGTASDGSTALSRGGTTGTAAELRSDLGAEMYWYPTANPSAYNTTPVPEYFRKQRGGTAVVEPIELGIVMANGAEIFCFDMHGSVGDQGMGADITWQENSDPLVLEPFFFSGSHADSRPKYELHGIVLSHIPLTDIPLPIRTHVG
jgi:hypothetical protein